MNRRFTLIDREGRLLLRRSFENVTAQTLNRVSAKYAGQWGLFDGCTDEWMFEPRFEELREFDGSVTSGKSAGKWGLIRDDGQRVGHWSFQLIAAFRGGLAAATVGEKVGFIDEKGDWAIAPKYSHASGFSHGFAAVSIATRKEGYVDLEGTPITGFDFAKANPFSAEGLAFVQSSDLQGFIDTTGKIVLDGSWFDDAHIFSEGFCRYYTFEDVESPGVGFLDLHGKPVFDRVFERASSFRDGFATVRIDEKWGAIDRSGNLVIPPEYELLDECSCGLMMATKDGLCGYITPRNEVAIPFEFLGGRAFTKSGIAVVLVADDSHV